MLTPLKSKVVHLEGQFGFLFGSLFWTFIVTNVFVEAFVPIRFASEAWPQPGLAEPRSASIAGFGNTGPLSST